ncbi:MAG: hypothetical protein IJR98_03550 [Synergistaceae bacterium]|nr:hypothetical protein [Synergistaceae bacterium]
MTTDDDNDAARILVPLLYSDTYDTEEDVDQEADKNKKKKEGSSRSFIAWGAIVVVLGLAFVFRGLLLNFVQNLAKTNKETVESGDVAVKVMQPVKLEPFSADLSGVNKGGFGPVVAGVQIGMKMALSDIIKWRAGLRGFPFTLELNTGRSGETEPAITGSIAIRFSGSDGILTDFDVTKASGGLYRLKNENLELPDLLAEIEKSEVVTVTLRGANDLKENCLLFDNELRISSIYLRKSDFDSASMSQERFVEFLTETYNLPRMRRRGDLWQFINETEGWRINYYTLSGGIFEVRR